MINFHNSIQPKLLPLFCAPHALFKFGCLIALLLSASILFPSCNQPKDKLRIASAANMQFVMPLLTATFTQETGIPCEVIYASSGKLSAQIQAGAPYDIFISADMKYPNELFAKEITLGKPEVYALGKLVLWSSEKNKPISFEYLHDKSIQHIALANPKTAPYGRAAKQVLAKIDTNNLLQSKLVYGESIAQTNQFITTGAATIGFTAKSVVLASHLQHVGQWIDVPESDYELIEQGICVIKNSKKQTEAKQFYRFLLSVTASEILHTFGYDSPTQSAN